MGRTTPQPNPRPEDDVGEAAGERDGLLLRALGRFAAIGNRLPDPVTLFVLLAAAVVLASLLLAGTSEEVTQRDGTVVR